MFLGVDDRRKGGGDDHPLDGGCVRFDGFQNARRALDGRIEEVLDGILDVEMERRGCVKDIVEGCDFDGLIR